MRDHSGEIMDTVQEEDSSRETSPTSSLNRKDCIQSSFNTPTIIIHPVDEPETSKCTSSTSSRRPSAILAALRRPSQSLVLSTAHAIMSHKKQQTHNEQKPFSNSPESEAKLINIVNNNKIGDDALTTILSAFYAKLLVVLGIAFPITEIISNQVERGYYKGFYMYLYSGSLIFMVYMYATVYRKKVVQSIFTSHDDDKQQPFERRSLYHNVQNAEKKVIRYGSFYLRLGAIGFGIGSMVFTGLEFGYYFEQRGTTNCNTNILNAITPAIRMILTIVQIQFIFLNGKDINTAKHRIISRFGLMHMIATNLCEWLYVLIEETDHEIIHLNDHHEYLNGTSHVNQSHCKAKVMGPLMINASPFLFPCTIEYSLICAVILFEMWKNVKTEKKDERPVEITKRHRESSHDKLVQIFNFHNWTGNYKKSANHFTLDCTKSHKGLFAGILVIVVTIISLTMFFVLRAEKGTPEEEAYFKSNAQLEVNIVEILIHIVSTGAVIAAMVKFRNLNYEKRSVENSLMGMDNTLLVVAQTGMFIYCMFSIIGSYFRIKESTPAGLLAEMFSLIQTCLQTLFVLDGWFRRCRTSEQQKRKPGRELITFLIVANMAMWGINALEKNRAEFRTDHLQFYGEWPYTIITHISMPLAIFYRFHSTICLFEIWKSAYKFKPNIKNNLFEFL
ncbi:proton channel OtopLc-like [Onthophagus taurus]|uniref:proton channel OtopLc-like n=1 Tax=Onthophagus taurus TaxID=166361 RepID=UPI0039BDCAB4